MDLPSSKILLKDASSMSLDERFTIMLQNQQARLSDIRDTVPQNLTASASLKNRRLVQEIANRPSVMAALQNTRQQQFKGSIKARLGRRVLRGGLHDMSRFWGRPRGRGILTRGALTQRSSRGMQIVGRGMAERSPRQDCRPLLTREELDAQLDEYMSMSKSHLDAQLDAYMAEIDSEDLL
ncbi:Chromatin target of PRMT1 protein [Bagarius yarrelli]|uniref:Chromatin target of PRMT1 protein n=1 Tax=Bagarius yarrelli TaxID=175774 RepID=A0A556TQ07_BAGYA|nr:Chromatin target of PRMT1 protein [Bagarius yarrelli]